MAVKTTGETEIYDMTGRRLPVKDTNSLSKGIYIIKKGNRSVKIQK